MTPNGTIPMFALKGAKLFATPFAGCAASVLGHCPDSPADDHLGMVNGSIRCVSDTYSTVHAT